MSKEHERERVLDDGERSKSMYVCVGGGGEI